MEEIMDDYIRIDSHVHVKADYPNSKIIDSSSLEESLRKNGIGGAIVLMHSKPEEYEKNFYKMKDFCKDYSYMIPAVEISKKVEVKVKDSGIKYKITCHATYLGDIPKRSGKIEIDMNHSSWFCHVNKKRGIFFEALYRKIEDEFISLGEPSIVESTTNIFDAINLRQKGHIVLLGSDAHPSINCSYNFLGKNGMLIKAKKFDFNVFMDSLQSNNFGYFSNAENNLYYITPEDFTKNKIIINKI